MCDVTRKWSGEVVLYPGPQVKMLSGLHGGLALETAMSYDTDKKELYPSPKRSGSKCLLRVGLMVLPGLTEQTAQSCLTEPQSPSQSLKVTHILIRGLLPYPRPTQSHIISVTYMASLTQAHGRISLHNIRVKLPDRKHRVPSKI